MEKIISFIIPSYNVEKYLETALNSFISESIMDKIEVLVINDGSADRTEQTAVCFTEKFPDTFFLINKENGGHGSAINVGTRRAVGKYIKVIDADDWVVTDNLKEFIEELTNCEADVVLTPYHRVDMLSHERTAICAGRGDYGRVYEFEEIMQNWDHFETSFAFHGITYRREFYQKYRHELLEGVFYEDQEYAAIPACHAASIYPLDLFIYEYLVGNSEQSVSDANKLKRISHIETVAMELAGYEKKCRGLSEISREFLYQKAEDVILSYYVTACVINPDKSQGREMCVKFNQLLEKRNEKFYQRIRKKYLIYLVMSYLRINNHNYERILHSEWYQRIRHG